MNPTKMHETVDNTYNITQEYYMSNKFLLLSQILESLQTDNSVLCDPATNASCLEENVNIMGPNLSILNDTSDYDIEDIMGPRRDPHAISMTVVYLVLLITGVIGNVCTCIVIARNRYMHTATNYYLFSLAISDLMLLVLGLPQDLHHLWSRFPYTLGEVFCVLRGWSSETSTNASILTITAFTVERYLAICHPIRAHTMSRLSRAVKFIIVIWILAALSAISMGYQLGIVYLNDDDGNIIPETATCNVKRPLDHAFEWSTFLFFFFPATILCILYALIGLQLRRSTDIGRKHDGPSQKINSNGTTKSFGKCLNEQGKSVARKSSSTSRKDVIKMLVAVVIAFFICWAPFHAQRLMAIYIPEPTSAEIEAFGYLTNISGLLYYVSATINPILYSILSLKFRHAFRDTLGRCLGRGSFRRDRGRHMSLYNSTLRSAGYEVTDLTVVSEVGHLENINGSKKPYRNLEFKEVVISSAPLARKKTGSTISNASLRVTDAFEDSGISEYIDEVKDSRC